MPIDRPKVAKLLLPTELKAVPRVPLRPEMSQEEIERYPERLRRHEERAALARQAETPEAVDHRKTCQSEGCADPAHVRPRRLLRDETPLDRRHLGCCLMEDPDCFHPSHLLPPHPLKVEDEWCCAGRHYRAGTPQALAECPMVPVWLRERRTAEQAAFREAGSGFVSMVVRRDWTRGKTATIADQKGSGG